MRACSDPWLQLPPSLWRIATRFSKILRLCLRRGLIVSITGVVGRYPATKE